MLKNKLDINFTNTKISSNNTFSKLYSPSDKKYVIENNNYKSRCGENYQHVIIIIKSHNLLNKFIETNKKELKKITYIKDNIDEQINNENEDYGFGKIYKTDLMDPIKRKEYNQRPTFHAFNDKSNLIRAGGLIYYKFKNNKLQFLLIKCNNVYEDFGGKTDKVDESFEDTIAREAREESNGIFEEDEILMEICEKNLAYYKKSKYIVSLLETKKEYDPTDFGDIEHHTNIKRTVEWVDYDDIITKNNLHIRLKFDNFCKKIENIKNYYDRVSHL